MVDVASHIITSYMNTGCPKKNVLIELKLSAVGLNLTMNMTWEGSFRLSLSKKRPKH